MVAAEILPTRLEPEVKGTSSEWKHVEKAERLSQAGMLEEALLEDQLAAAETPESAEILNNLGTSYARLGRLDDAVDAFTRALTMTPAHPMVRRNLAFALAQLDRIPEALEVIGDVHQPILQGARRTVLDLHLRKLVRKGIISWSGGKPKGFSPKLEITSGEPLSDWIIKNRR
jgi:regulator of sirC expression with transglutaminase-like and TPR domain